MSELRVYSNLNIHNISEVPADIVAQKNNNCHAVIFDHPDTEAKFSKSFYFYAKSTARILDLFELDSLKERRKLAFKNNETPKVISQTTPEISVILY